MFSLYYRATIFQLTRRIRFIQFNMAAPSSQNLVSLRSLSCELGLLNKTDGSALFSQGMCIGIVNLYLPSMNAFGVGNFKLITTMLAHHCHQAFYSI